MNQSTTRRSFLRNTALAAGVAALARPLGAFAADEAKKKIPIAVQLYSVRNELKTDFEGVIAKLGKMGYQAVEWYGGIERGHKAKDLKKLLDDNGLKTCGTHTALITLQGDALKSTIDFHKELGNTFLICPSMNGKTEQDWLGLAKQFNNISAKCREQGMFTGYHSHAGDFKNKYNGKTTWEIFFDNTDKDVIHQIDVGNTLDGGGDPLAMIKKYPGRTRSTHINEHGGADKEAAIGNGAVNWKEMFEAYESVGGTEWYIVEYEHSNPLEKLKTCIDNLHKMGK
jgi:sugar phosphate isomerase/epimerase